MKKSDENCDRITPSDVIQLYLRSKERRKVKGIRYKKGGEKIKISL